jgi:hypothetical protein
LQQYIYVTDDGDATHAPQVLAYPMGVSNPAPVASVTLTDTPEGVAVDSTGKVYVALWNSGTVVVFKPGLRSPTPVRTLASPDLYRPEGVAIDEQDAVYVSSHCQTPGCESFVAKFQPGTNSNPSKISAPAGDAVHGVAARNGYLYMNLSQSVGGAVTQYVNGVQQNWMLMLGSSTGVALDNTGNIYVANIGLLQGYTPPSHQAFRSENEGQCAVRFVGRGSDGSIYAPVNGVGWAAVVGWPAGSSTQYSITTGLTTPVGAAAD